MGRQIHFHMLGGDCDAFFAAATHQSLSMVRTIDFHTMPTSGIRDWDGRPAVAAGRLYAADYQGNRALADWYEKLAGMVVAGVIEQPDTSALPALIMVAKIVAGLPTCTERLAGSVEAKIVLPTV